MQDIEDLKQQGYTKLMLAILEGDQAEIEDHLKTKINLDQTTDSGLNALTIAICAGETEIARSLVDVGIDIDQKDNSGLVPLHWAVLCGNRDMVAILSERSSYSQDEYPDGRTLLEVAKTAGDDEIVQALKNSAKPSPMNSSD